MARFFSRENLKPGTGAGVITYGGLDDVNCAKDWLFVDVGNATDSAWNFEMDGYVFPGYHHALRRADS